jgi:hypothetical protein
MLRTSCSAAHPTGLTTSSRNNRCVKDRKKRTQEEKRWMEQSEARDEDGMSPVDRLIVLTVNIASLLGTTCTVFCDCYCAPRSYSGTYARRLQKYHHAPCCPPPTFCPHSDGLDMVQSLSFSPFIFSHSHLLASLPVGTGSHHSNLFLAATPSPQHEPVFPRLR